ncbi:hypothetical protein AaE_005922, partial [Aphanomyces astaci]
MAALFLANESVGTDDAFPSTFELIMQERMASGFKPAAQYFLTAICDAYPHVASTLPVRHFHETYALVLLGIERYCLSNYDCLLVERFYGIKRMELTDTVDIGGKTAPQLKALTERGRRRSLFWQVGVSYLKAKADAYYHSLLNTSPLSSHSAIPPSNDVDEEAAPSANQSRLHRFWWHWRRLRLWSELRCLFVDIYPAVHFSYEGLFFIYQWMYLFGHTKHFTPVLRAMRAVLARLTPQDVSTFETTRTRHRAQVLASLTPSASVPNASRSSWSHTVRRWMYQATWATLDYSQTIVVVAIVGFKFMEWLQSDMNLRGRPNATGGVFKETSSLPPPPPPTQPALTHSAISLSSETRRCGLCRRPRTNPASCVSGFVFCYPCIHSYVQ